MRQGKNSYQQPITVEQNDFKKRINKTPTKEHRRKIGILVCKILATLSEKLDGLGMFDDVEMEMLSLIKKNSKNKKINICHTIQMKDGLLFCLHA